MFRLNMKCPQIFQGRPTYPGFQHLPFMSPKTFLILGGTGASGILVTERALHNKHRVVLYVRNPAKLPAHISSNSNVTVRFLIVFPLLLSILLVTQNLSMLYTPMKQRELQVTIDIRRFITQTNAFLGCDGYSGR